MTGLAACFGADPLPGAGPSTRSSSAAARPPESTAESATSAIMEALAARGSATATWSAGGAHLVVRGELPVVHKLASGAVLVDGDVAPGALAAAYTESGARGLVSGSDEFGGYAALLADLTRDTLLLARSGEGPPLYWARSGRCVLVASEPAALIAAGLPAEPDLTVVHRFLTTGACDEGPATFFAGVRRVLAGQVVEVTRDPAGCRVQVHDPSPAGPAGPAGAAGAAGAAGVSGAAVPPETLVPSETFRGRIGVRLGCGLGAAAVLGSALAGTERPRPLPVYSSAFPELAAVDSSAYCAATLLGPYALGAARHRALPFFLDEIDIDAYLADLGEPTPELEDWLCWAVARRVAGEVDALVDASAGAHLSRLADRITSRFGVDLRAPLWCLPEGRRQAELAAVVERTLPSSAAGFAAATQVDRGRAILLPELLRGLRTDLVATLLAPRLDDYLDARSLPGGLADVLSLVSGGRVDAAAVWRRYLLERWLRRPPFDPPPPARVDHGVFGRVARRAGDDIHDQPDGAGPRRGAGGWEQVPVRTDLFQAGDQVAEKVAWYAGEAVAALAPAGQWFVLLAAKPAAVGQARARNLWEIAPGLTARALGRLSGARKGLRGPAALAATQVALDERGWWRMVGAALAAITGRLGWASRLAGPLVRAIRQPRPDAPPPAHVAVVPAPTEPDRLAREIVAALRATLPASFYTTLGGCAVVTDEVIGWAPRPGASAPPGGRAALSALAASGPFEGRHTPVVLALPVGMVAGTDCGGGEPAGDAADGSEDAGGVVRRVPTPGRTPGAPGGGAESQRGPDRAERREGG